jgi:Pathogenicity locus
MSSDIATATGSDLLELANVGPAVARYLGQVGITQTRQLAGRDAVEIYEEMCAESGRRLDPCLLDTVMSAVEQADGGTARPWWDYTAERKRMLSGQSRRLTR